MKDGFNLTLSFTLASGNKKKLIFSDAKETQNPADVKALMQHIVNNNIIENKGDAIIGIDKAFLQKITTAEISL